MAAGDAYFEEFFGNVEDQAEEVVASQGFQVEPLTLAGTSLIEVISRPNEEVFGRQIGNVALSPYSAAHRPAIRTLSDVVSGR